MEHLPTIKKILTVNLFLLAIFFSIVVFPRYSYVSAAVEDQIDQKESEKEAKEKDISASEKAELEAQLAKLPLSEQLKLVQKNLDEKNAAISSAEKTISEKQSEIEKTLLILAQTKEIINKQMLEVYIASRTRTLSIFFSGKTPQQIMRDLIFRNTSVKMLAEDLRKLQEAYTQAENTKKSLEGEKAKLTSEKQLLEKQKKDLEARIALIQAQINAQNKTQASLRNEVLALDKEISQLSAAAKKKLDSKSGNDSDSGGGTPGNGGGSVPIEGNAGTYDIYKNNVLVQGGVVGPVELIPTSGVRFVVGSKSYRGDLIFRQDSNVYMINRLPVQDYLKGIGEMPSSWNAEALKAQAVAARTYAYANWNKRIAYKYNLLDNTNDQNYVGYGKETSSYGTNWVSAVNNTDNKVIKKDGSLITAWYHSTCGGHTIGSSEKWGGYRNYAIGNSDRYTIGTIVRAYDEASPFYQKRWGSSAINNDGIIDLINAAIYLQKNNASTTSQNQLISGQPGYLNPTALATALGSDSLQNKIGAFSSVVQNYDTGGSAIGLNTKHTASIVATGAGGSLTIDDAYFELAYNLRSPGTNYIASSLWYITQQSGSWNVYSMGYGHRVGMCQYGANGRAAAGQNYSTIISAYYNGSQVVDQSSPSSQISVGITQAGGASTVVSRDGGFDIYSNGSKIFTAASGESWKIVKK